MSRKLFEVVPNFSEGRDAEKVSRIADSVRAVPGVRVLDLHSDPDHNRSVLTLVGEKEPLVEASVALARACVREIDLAAQRGVHPRIGSLDVLPFVPLGPPLSDTTLQEAVRLAKMVGKTIGALGLPVYLYGAAASAPHRENLAEVRRGGYKGLVACVGDPLWEPDYGPEEIPRRSGAVAVGARPFLVAFNAYLDTKDVEVAHAIAGEVRERDGGRPGLKALGLEVGGRAQVSMNLTDLERTPLPAALEAVRRSAEKRGVRVESTELVGMVPLSAVLEAACHYLALPELGPERDLLPSLFIGRIGALLDGGGVAGTVTRVVGGFSGATGHGGGRSRTRPLSRGRRGAHLSGVPGDHLEPRAGRVPARWGGQYHRQPHGSGGQGSSGGLDRGRRARRPAGKDTGSRRVC